jgi:DNA replication initiation complex subunit (GINS family)
LIIEKGKIIAQNIIDEEQKLFDLLLEGVSDAEFRAFKKNVDYIENKFRKNLIFYL